jgi:hypothetical protein
MATSPAPACHPEEAGSCVVVDGFHGSLAAVRWQCASVRTRPVGARGGRRGPMQWTFGDVAAVGDFRTVIAAEEIWYRPSPLPTR